VLAVRGRKILRMVTSTGFLTRKDLYRISIIFFKFKHENVIKMKNKLDPAILQPSNLSNEIKKDTKISRDYPFKQLVKSSHSYFTMKRTLFEAS
jgi:hypothetical protein